MLEHFNKSDQEFIIKATGWVNQVFLTQKIKITNFLNPHEQSIIKTLVNQNEELDIIFEGGFINAERNRGIIFPNYLRPKHVKKNIVGFQIKRNKKFLNIDHKQILGSLISLKIDRSIIGDIVFLENDEIYFAVCDEFGTFFQENFKMIGRDSISIFQKEIHQIEKINHFEELEIIVSSMRLDVVVAALMDASRSIVHEYIKQGFVQLNHTGEKNHSHQCQIGDILSIKRYGRYKLISYKKTTKRQKHVLVVNKAI